MLVCKMRTGTPCAGLLTFCTCIYVRRPCRGSVCTQTLRCFSRNCARGHPAMACLHFAHVTTVGVQAGIGLKGFALCRVTVGCTARLRAPAEHREQQRGAASRPRAQHKPEPPRPRREQPTRPRHAGTRGKTRIYAARGAGGFQLAWCARADDPAFETCTRVYYSTCATDSTVLHV